MNFQILENKNVWSDVCISLNTQNQMNDTIIKILTFLPSRCTGKIKKEYCNYKAHKHQYLNFIYVYEKSVVYQKGGFWGVFLFFYFSPESSKTIQSKKNYQRAINNLILSF